VRVRAVNAVGAGAASAAVTVQPVAAPGPTVTVPGPTVTGPTVTGPTVTLPASTLTTAGATVTVTDAVTGTVTRTAGSSTGTSTAVPAPPVPHGGGRLPDTGASVVTVSVAAFGVLALGAGVLLAMIRRRERRGTQ
jgi:LPXTG-motif cell wall-anchored protein